MVYEKEVSFSYPVLCSFTNDYVNNNFNFDIDIMELEKEIVFNIKYDINSDFIKEMLNQKFASIYLLINSKDSHYYEVDVNELKVTILKRRLSLGFRSQFQLAIISKKSINFTNNFDLVDELLIYKERINIKENSILALSVIQKFDGEIKKPFHLFRIISIPNQKETIKIDTRGEFIQICFNDDKLKYNTFKEKKSLKYHYVYMGLQKALMLYIFRLAEDQEKDPLDPLEIKDDYSPEDPLIRKLHYFLRAKKISKISFDMIDIVIETITDKLIQRHYNAIERLNNYES